MADRGQSVMDIQMMSYPKGAKQKRGRVLQPYLDAVGGSLRPPVEANLQGPVGAELHSKLVIQSCPGDLKFTVTPAWRCSVGRPRLD